MAQEALKAFAVVLLLALPAPGRPEIANCTAVRGCLSSGNGYGPLLTSMICEGSSGSITCSGDTRIHIEHANYGRLSSSPCLGSMEDVTNCTAPSTDALVKTACEDRASWSFAVNNDNMGGDPCPGVTKYLLIHYKCFPTSG